MQSLVIVHAEKYSHSMREVWNEFNRDAKNGIFLFDRDFMEYHSDRFMDHSLMFKDGDGRMVAEMPAHVDGATIYSHNGLTFGGVISGFDMTTEGMLSVFSSMNEYLLGQGIDRLVYKALPHIYHLAPAEEDLYALYRLGARLTRRDVSSAIYLPHAEQTGFWRMRSRKIHKAEQSGLAVGRSYEFDSFMDLLSRVLIERHGVKPVHTNAEIKRLAQRFPDNIKLYTATSRSGALEAGVIVFEHNETVHAQYNANSPGGKEMGALDIVYEHLIKEVYPGKKYFDFGISTEKEGMFLNEGLLKYKESFGARAIAHDFYELNLRDSLDRGVLP